MKKHLLVKTTKIKALILVLTLFSPELTFGEKKTTLVCTNGEQPILRISREGEGDALDMVTLSLAAENTTPSGDWLWWDYSWNTPTRILATRFKCENLTERVFRCRASNAGQALAVERFYDSKWIRHEVGFIEIESYQTTHKQGEDTLKFHNYNIRVTSPTLKGSLGSAFDRLHCKTE